jgi:RHS repeat-associated protein
VRQIVGANAYEYINDTVTPLPVVLNENGPDGNIACVYGLSLIAAGSATFQNYYQFDGLGSTINLTDPTGAMKANYAYDPWGRSLTPMDPQQGRNKYRLSGEAFDLSSGLYYLRARYYDPTIGRFLSPDPVMLPEMPGANSYTYVANNPSRFVDPSGQSLWDAAKKFRSATWEAVASVPSFIWCSLSFSGMFRADQVCRSAGFTETEVKIGTALTAVVTTAVVPGGAGVVAIEKGVHLLPVAGRMARGELSVGEALKEAADASVSLVLGRSPEFRDMSDVSKELIEQAIKLLITDPLWGPPGVDASMGGGSKK